VALAPDPDGSTTHDSAEAGELMQQLPVEQLPATWPARWTSFSPMTR